MTNKRVAYIVPGGGHSPRRKEYKTVAAMFRRRSIKPVSVPIQWRRSTLDDWIAQLLNAYRKNGGDEVYLFGFSFGATIAAIASLSIRPKMLLLCSLPARFAEDMPFSKKVATTVGARRTKVFKRYVFSDLAKEITSKTVIFVGDKEQPDLLRRCRIAHRKIKKSKLITLKDTDHDIREKGYMGAIRKTIARI